MKFKRRQHHLSPPYVSMADIAFNLVLFFLIMARVKSDDHIEWKAARAEGTTKATKGAVVISTGYRKDDPNKAVRVFINGEETGVSTLADDVQRRLDADASKDRTVLLRIHQDTLASTFEKVMEAVSQAGGEVFHVLEEDR